MDFYFQTQIRDHFARATDGVPSTKKQEKAVESDMIVSDNDIMEALARASAVLEEAIPMADLDLHRQGSAPSSTETQRFCDISTELSAQSVRLGGLKQVVASADLAEALSALRKRIWRQLAILRSLIAPVRRLPQELLADIFVYFSTPCVPQDRARLVTKSVARVCYTWRAVARGTPELWTHFSTSEHSRPSTVVDAGLVALSRGRSISIYHALPNDDERLLELLEALSPYTARWGSLALTGLKASFSRLPVAELPSLEE
ncbi:hypothetical protein BD626DRAFT_213568, partial [Schizophyllum amplum]